MTAPPRRYRVWDKLNETEAHGRVLMAASPERAAALFAENDTPGQVAGVYTQDGHPICVRDEDGGVYEVVVVIERSTSFESRGRRRLH